MLNIVHAKTILFIKCINSNKVMSKCSIGCITSKNKYNSLILLFILVFSSVICSCESDRSDKGDTDEVGGLLALAEEFDESEQKWGFINNKGEVVIRGAYDELGNFSEGMAAFRIKAKWGYLDKTGKELIAAQYYNAFVYKDGLAKVSDFDRKYGMIDAQGKAIIPIQYDELRSFEEGKCAFKKDGKWGFIDKDNKVKIAAAFDGVKDYNNGKAIAKKAGQYFLIDESGNKVSDHFEKIYLLSSGQYKVRVDKKYGIVDRTGKYIVEAQYQSISETDDQTVAVKKDGQYSLLTLPNTKITTPENDNLAYLGEGRWGFEVNEKVGLLDNAGNVILQPTFKIITPFKAGFASYESDRLWGYLDSNGQVLTPPVFGLTWEFKEGLARVIGRQGVGYINTDGKYAFIADDFDARDFSEGLARMPLR